MPPFTEAASIVQRGVEERAYPAAVVEVGTRDTPIWQQAFGRLEYEAEAPVTQKDTLFDLASLTKVIATTSLVMRLVTRQAIAERSRRHVDSGLAWARP
jgi:CubicO group peptidase (beta-lactamase class C family)